MVIPIIAITGTSGKTTTKEMIYSILCTKYKTFKSFQNGNDVWYTSQYVKQINSSYDAIVLEYGMLKKGDIKEHCKLIKPNYGIITNIGEAHIGNFEDGIQGIAAAKSELIEGMDKNSVFFKNSDHPNSNLINLNHFKGKIINIGFTNKSHYTANDIKQKKDGTYFKATLGNNHTCAFFIPSYGKHNVSNALFAIALSHELGFSVEQIQLGLKTYEKPYSRLDVNYLRDDIIIIDDTFNTKPSSMKAAIDTLSQMPHKNNKIIAVLGCMRDLGKYSTLFHKEIGEYVAAANIDYLYTIGAEAELIKLEAIKFGFPSNKTLHFQSKASLLEYFLKSNLIRTTILFNGYSKVYSEVNKMSDIVDSLKQYYKN